MIIRDGIVLLEYAELVNDACLSEPAYKKAVRDGRIARVQKACPGHPALIEYRSLPAAYKEMVRHYLKGDPEDLARAQVVEQHLVLAKEDETYIHEFRASNGLGLSIAKMHATKQAARVLALLAEMDQVRNEGPEAVVRHYGMPVLEMKATIITYIKLHRIKLPASFSKLEARKRAYRNAREAGLPGASSLIHGAHGNTGASKVKDGDPAKVLRLLCSRHQNYGLRTIAQDFNKVAAKQGWKAITANTVKNFLADGANGRTAMLYSRGLKAYQDKYGIVIHRTRPSQPTYMWVHDGTDYELYYQKEVGGKRTFHHRKVVVVVVDPHSWYPVGFAIGDQDTIELTQEAYRNAVHHTRELTGQYLQPYQVQSDRLGYKSLTAWYKGMDIKYTPAAAKNARAKVIEPWFRQHNDHYVHRHLNWGGHNITSRKENQPNADALHALRHSFPTEAEVIEQIRACINAERADKVAGYVAALNAMPADARRLVTREQYLLTLGDKHQWTNELTNKGLMPTLNGEQRVYNRYDREFQDLLGTAFQVYSDPYDHSDILATARDGSLRHLVPSVQAMPMALADHTPELREQLDALRAVKLNLSQAAIDALVNDRDVVRRLADELLADTLPAVRRKRAEATARNDMRPTAEQEAVERGYFIGQGGSHKQALQAVKHTDEDIARRALKDL